MSKDGAHVANVSSKLPADGAGRLYAYVHWIGLERVRDHANGYGYDKRTAAVSGCAARILKHLDAPMAPGSPATSAHAAPSAPRSARPPPPTGRATSRTRASPFSAPSDDPSRCPEWPQHLPRHAHAPPASKTYHRKQP